MNRLFYTTGKRDIIEEEWNKPNPGDREIEVKSILTGICRSDIDMYNGTFQTLPKYIQGHESVGVVTKVGRNIINVKEGDYVATRGEPAFADYYNCKANMYVKVPESSPKYILEPIACGLNVEECLHVTTTDPILILGSGFLATIVYTALNRNYTNKVIVVGDANKYFWDKHNVEMTTAYKLGNSKFKYVIDLSDKPEYLSAGIYDECAKVILAAEKHPAVSTTFSEFLWNAVDVKFPSPRNTTFYSAMCLAEELVTYGEIDPAPLWTKSYSRDTEVKLAFEDGLNRPLGYSRGYITW